MNRKILVQMTAPAVVIGLILMAACLISVLYINRLQRDIALVLSKNVRSLEAAQGLEIETRRLRYQSFLYLIDHSPDRRKSISEDHQQFEQALQVARDSVTNAEEQRLVDIIQVGYDRYHKEIDEFITSDVGKLPRRELARQAGAPFPFRR